MRALWSCKIQTLLSQFAIHFFIKDGNFKARWYYKCNDVCKIENSFLFLVHKKDIRCTQSCITSLYGNNENSKTIPKLSIYDFLCILLIRNINCTQNLRQISSPESLEGCVIPVCNERDSNSTSFRAYQVIILKALA